MKSIHKIDLNNYTTLDKIAEGQFGIVYKIKGNRTHKIFAAKVLKYDIKDNENDDFTRNLKQEISIISRIRHPLILKFIGVSMNNEKNDNNENKPVIVTDYVPGGSLSSLLSQSEESAHLPNWNNTTKFIIIYGIAAALEFLHSKNIIHRDLKPANILLNENMFPIIADFGLSKDETDLSNSNYGIKGTPIYTAPEIWEDCIYSKESDVYAFAFIVYEIIANKKPYKKLNLFKLQALVCQGERPDISFIDEPYKTLIEKCWCQEPNERPMFKEIVEELKTNPNFLNDLEDKRKFENFVDYIDKSPKDFISLVDPKYQKIIDIVFLIDGTYPNTHLINSVQNSFYMIALKCHAKYPKTYFRFGVVVYYNLIESQKSNKKGFKYPQVLNLTDSFEEVKKFLNSIEISGGGIRYANDWACGYHAISDNIIWEKNAEKIVIQICNSPAHGKYFTIDQANNNKIKIPHYKKKAKFSLNKKIFDEIQEKQNNWLIVNIRRLADEDVKFYCLNGNEISLFCFNQVMKKFTEVGGKKYVIKDLFGYSSIKANDSVNMEALNEEFQSFFLNVIDACSNNNNQFEKECQFQFEKDLSSFLTGDKTLENTISILENEISKAKSLILNNVDTSPNSSISEMINELNNHYQKQSSHHQHEIKELKEKMHKIEIERDDFKAKYNNLNKKRSEPDLLSLKNQVKSLTDEKNKYQVQSQKLIKENHELQLQIQQLKDDKNEIQENNDKIITDLKKEKKELNSKYNSLWSKNHHNYELIGDMKKILIHDVNLTGDENKLGGVDMTKRALAKKDEMIESLREQLKSENHHKMNKNRY